MRGDLRPLLRRVLIPVVWRRRRKGFPAATQLPDADRIERDARSRVYFAARPRVTEEWNYAVDVISPVRFGGAPHTRTLGSIDVSAVDGQNDNDDENAASDSGQRANYRAHLGRILLTGSRRRACGTESPA